MQLEDPAEVRKIQLPKGGVLEVQLSKEFIERVKLHFGLDKHAPVDDDHVRMFIFGAFKTAIDKAE